MNYVFDWSVIVPSLDLFLQGLSMTFQISVAAYFLAIIVGLLSAILSMIPFVSWINRLYVELFRAVPLLVIIIWIYYGASLLFGLKFTAFMAGVTAIGLHFGAFLSEIFRAGIQAVARGQAEAALVLGLNRAQIMRRIVLPQAIRIVIPPLGNTWIEMMKSATLVSVIGLTELMRVGQTLVASTFRPFEIYTFVALVYFVLTIVSSSILSHIEKRLAIKA